MGRIVPGLPDRVTEDIVLRVTGAVDATAIYVFGSRARGDHRPDSDVDIMVLCPGADGADRHRIATKVGAAFFGFPMSKDVMTESPETFWKAADKLGTTEATVAREGILIYGDRQGG